MSDLPVTNAVWIERVHESYLLDSVRMTGSRRRVRADRAKRGASCSGKTTLLNMIDCVDRRGSGRAVIAGEDSALLSDSLINEFHSRHRGEIE
ncbi:hypothetical protein J8I87_14310 [Paraburkholderia sp. LEh10]|uniref:hypothetical protein n=1 Tax=Paraburkholderia sp. LEh10 TaxID=2821353 RepID=UPI001AE12FC2|nr:hypothetical protein [Paraburkholderia sp. LEh10]MBP0590864.1 hypothetical protein [Paraburkholderia sp. LEh10]